MYLYKHVACLRNRCAINDFTSDAHDQFQAYLQLLDLEIYNISQYNCQRTQDFNYDSLMKIKRKQKKSEDNSAHP
jgi:hypothetical protein